MHTITDHGLIANFDALLKSRFTARQLQLGENKHLRFASSCEHISKFKGRGMDFAEVRAYCPGDDVRYMDWRVTARTGTPHIKVYQEERERPVYFVVDYTPSMHFGTRKTYKAVMAANVLAHLAFAAIYKKDRVGGVLFSGESHIEIKPSHSEGDVIHFLKHLANEEYLQQNQSQSDAFVQTLKRVNRLARPGSMVYILSDFSNFSAALKEEISQLKRSREVYNLFFYDPIEKQMPQKGSYTFSDGQHRMRINLHKPSAINKYESIFLERMAWLKTLFVQQGVSYIDFSTEANILTTLQRYSHLRG